AKSIGFVPENEPMAAAAPSIGRPPGNQGVAAAAFDTLNAALEAVQLFFLPARATDMEIRPHSPEVGALASAVLPDIKMLRYRAEHEKWDDQTPVPAGVFGPLWPEGVPDGWPKSSRKEDAAPAKVMPHRWVRIVGTAKYELGREALFVSPLVAV